MNNTRYKNYSLSSFKGKNWFFSSEFVVYLNEQHYCSEHSSMCEHVAHHLFHLEE